MNMACVENVPPQDADSEMEEGEIVDDLSDISSEEEFLLRQRLQVLENYNNVLERKKAKRSSVGPGTKHKKADTLLYDLSEISATELDDYYSHAPTKTIKVQKRQRTHHRQKRKKEEPIVNAVKTKDHKKRNHHCKKKLEVKIISESSEESEDEYRNRRRKLADAVVVNKDINKNDKTSLSERLQKMLYGVNPEPLKLIITESKLDPETENKIEQSAFSPISPLNIEDGILNFETQECIPEKVNSCELIDLCTDEDSKTTIKSPAGNLQEDTVDSVNKNIEIEEDTKKTSKKNFISDKDSDEDLELLRQHALKTKTMKTIPVTDDVIVQSETKILSEDEDSDTAELRLICLKSALLKKAIEMKQKQKLKKRLSQSSNFPEDLLNPDNNTDIESVDMDIGSDGDDKIKEYPICAKIDVNEKKAIPDATKVKKKDIPKLNVPDNDELDDDEDLLRAKLLTSLSKNLPNLVNPNIIDTVESIKDIRPISPKPPQGKPTVPAIVPEEKRFIINLGESDSEGEHEATKNLTKMHMKLSEQIDFQQRLDMFLKSTRLEVEKTTLPDVVQQPAQPKKNEKFVAKAVKHLPKSEQIEYKNLVKRMAELEKIKLARQSTMNNLQRVITPIKDTLKPRNATNEASKLSAINSLEEKIKSSRKHIAEESAKMLKLKEEGTKLSQKYKIVATELRNIKTAIALNRKQTRSVQNCLTKIRLHHQTLLKSSMTSSHSKYNSNMPQLKQIIPKLQKENNPVKEEYKNPSIHKPTKVVAKEPPLVIQHPRLSIQVDVTNKREVVIMAGDKTDAQDKSKLNIVTIDRNVDLIENHRLSSHPVVEKGGGNEETDVINHKRVQNDDYRSPLDAFGSSTWEGDPNAILCPFEVGGDCKDSDCKYLHTKSLTK